VKLIDSGTELPFLDPPLCEALDVQLALDIKGLNSIKKFIFVMEDAFHFL
jgi:hypothetical protein